MSRNIYIFYYYYFVIICQQRMAKSISVLLVVTKVTPFLRRSRCGRRAVSRADTSDRRFVLNRFIEFRTTCSDRMDCRSRFTSHTGISRGRRIKRQDTRTRLHVCVCFFFLLRSESFDRQTANEFLMKLSLESTNPDGPATCH